jgi:hypothetical protein
MTMEAVGIDRLVLRCSIGLDRYLYQRSRYGRRRFYHPRSRTTR